MTTAESSQPEFDPSAASSTEIVGPVETSQPSKSEDAEFSNLFADWEALERSTQQDAHSSSAAGQVSERGEIEGNGPNLTPSTPPDVVEFGGREVVDERPLPFDWSEAPASATPWLLAVVALGLIVRRFWTMRRAGSTPIQLASLAMVVGAFVIFADIVLADDLFRRPHWLGSIHRDGLIKIFGGALVAAGGISLTIHKV